MQVVHSSNGGVVGGKGTTGAARGVPSLRKVREQQQEAQATNDTAPSPPPPPMQKQTQLNGTSKKGAPKDPPVSLAASRR